jgi:hypothetical protein
VKIFRSHINTILKLALSSFVLSWLLLFLVSPLQIVALGKTHQVFSIFNPDEGCFDLILDHHQSAEAECLSDSKDHDLHVLHDSCCYDEFLLKTKKPDIKPDVSVIHSLFKPSTPWFQKRSLSTYLENNLPPPLVTLKILRVTRLLI